MIADVSVLIIACPCAMRLATPRPIMIMVGTKRIAEFGVLFHKGAALQWLQDVQVVAFDKTGTLTRGAQKLTDIACEGVAGEILRLVVGV